MATNWEYGGIYHQYDMEGEIRLPNESTVQVCDWTKALPDFMKQADTLFIDPPWNKGNMNTFYYKADMPHLDWGFLDFSQKLFERVDEISPRHLFVEMGKEYLHWYIVECKKRYTYVTFYNSTYYKKKQNKCYVIHATNDPKRRRYKELEDMDENDIIRWICTHHDYRCIGDLCMGRGLVGRYAYQNGKTFVGTELNKKRLAVLVDFITQKENIRHLEKVAQQVLNSENDV